MRILQVCSASEIGGGEVHVIGLVRALASHGHELYLAVRPNSPLREGLAGVNVSWHEMPLRNSLDIRSARTIAELVNDQRIDIVHAHMGRDYLVAALAERRAKQSRLILTRHHYLPMKQNAIYRWLLQDVAALIAVSRTVAKSCEERLTLDPGKVHVIPNWIEPSRFNPVDRETSRALFKIKMPLSVACIGQITPAKGQEEFIRAAAKLTRSRSDVEFVIAGVENDERGPFTAFLTDLAKKLGVADRVTFKGYVYHIPELLGAVDAVVVPSWDEGFSLVTLEAMAARRAVLASDVSAIREIIKDNSTGMLFPARDVSALASKLLWLLSDAPLRERIAAQGQRDAYARYNRDNIVTQIEALYANAINSGLERRVEEPRP
ncbi:MAG TPA: glycosyltransferase family 4 protein [Blastocatellia bacterium]